MNILLKAQYSFIASLLFYIVANPEFYKLTGRFGGWMECPSGKGLLVHTALFFSAMLALMTL